MANQVRNQTQVSVMGPRIVTIGGAPLQMRLFAVIHYCAQPALGLGLASMIDVTVILRLRTIFQKGDHHVN